MAAVSVRRGSTTMMRRSGLAARASSMRRKTIGCATSRVGAGDQQAVGEGDVLVAAGRRVGAERLLVAGHRRGHAQARVGVDVVGADQALGQLVEDVVVLGQQLPGNVEGDAVRAVRGDDLGKAVGGMVERRVPADALARLAALPTQFGMQQAIFRGAPSGAAWRPWCTGGRALAGCSGSPRTPTICSPSVSISSPQPTPQ
jgi:hypothetical protein